MLETLQEITVYMHGPLNERVCIDAQQNDTSSRKVRIHLLGFNNERYAVPPNAVAVLYVRKLDGHEVFDKCEVEESGSLIVTLRGQTVACSGKQRAQIYIVSADGAIDIKSQVFYLNVERAAYSEDAIESSDDYGVLRELIQSNKQIEAVVDEAVQAANDAADAALKATEDVKAAAATHASAIVETTSGEEIVLEDSADAALQGLKVFGKTEQFTTTGKNLFNPENVLNLYLDGNTGTLINSDATKAVYIACEPNTTYTVSKMKSARLAVGYTTAMPEKGIPFYDDTMVVNDATVDNTITTGANAVYLVAYVYHADYDTTVTVEDILDSIQIEKVPLLQPTNPTPAASQVRIHCIHRSW